MATTSYTKEQINEAIKVKSTGFASPPHYEGNVGGMFFESVDGEIHCIDDKGFHCYVCEADNKKQIVKEIQIFLKNQSIKTPC
ncbi:MAG: hypothetical protein ACOC22_01880 [bacterium]